MAAVLTFAALAPVPARAQGMVENFKEGYLHVSLGGGVAYFSKQYGSNLGGALHLTGWHYFTDRVFGALKAHVDLHSGYKHFYVP